MKLFELLELVASDDMNKLSVIYPGKPEEIPFFFTDDCKEKAIENAIVCGLDDVLSVSACDDTVVAECVPFAFEDSEFIRQLAENAVYRAVIGDLKGAIDIFEWVYLHAQINNESYYGLVHSALENLN